MIFHLKKLFVHHSLWHGVPDLVLTTLKMIFPLLSRVCEVISSESMSTESVKLDILGLISEDFQFSEIILTLIRAHF